MRFSSPEWLLLLPLLTLALWRWQALRSPLRIVCLVLALLLCTGPQARRFGRGLDVWVLADRSASAQMGVGARLPEWERILERSKGADDRLFFVDYATEVCRRELGESTGSPNATRTALAVQYALSQMASDRPARVLVLTDGYATDDLAPLAERLRRQNVPLDYRMLSGNLKDDFRVVSFQAPFQARPQEPFLMELRVSGPDTAALPYQVFRDGRLLLESTLAVQSGRGVARWSERLKTAGGHRYQVRILPANDPIPGNNSAERWLEITGGPRLLLVSAYSDDPLAAVLRAQGMEVELVANSAAAALDSGRLQGVRAVVLNNVHAAKLPKPFLDALDFFVRAQGGGLLMAGGKESFACGGYFGTAIADLLPVSMGLRKEQHKFVTALVVEIDRSGSMSMPLSDGREKMELAAAGAARAVELLGPHDWVSVVAMDTQPHEIVPLCKVGKDAPRLSELTRRITSAGGGINVYTALKDAHGRLRHASVGQRHVILFADANDALQEVGNYKEVLDEMRGDHITVSVIAMGNPDDSGAEFLNDVAARGGGRIFYSNADGLPALFEQETVAIARAAFEEKPAAGS